VGAAAVTVRLALAGFALLPLEVVSAFAAIVLVYVAPIADGTSTVTVHVPAVAPLPAGIERVAGSVTVPEPAVATTAPAPEQVVAALVGEAMTRPAGSVSTSAAVRFAAVVFALESVIVSVEAVFGATLPRRERLGERGRHRVDREVGGGRRRVVAVGSLQGVRGDRVGERAAEGAGHVHGHRARTGREAHGRRNRTCRGSDPVPVPVTATTAPAPEHVVAAFAGEAMTRPAGKVSVNAALSVAIEAFGLVSVIVSVEGRARVDRARAERLRHARAARGHRERARVTALVTFTGTEMLGESLV